VRLVSRILVDGHALEYVRIPGHERAPTLVFVHEGLGSVSTWREFPQRVAEACDCPALIYSRAGYGRSEPVSLPRPLDYMQHEGQVVLPALLAALGIDDTILIGHSDGASIALVYAAESARAAARPGHAHVAALVLEAPHVFCEPRSVEAIERAREDYVHGPRLRERLARHHDQVDVAFFGWSGAWLDPGFRAWNIEAFLPDVVAPCLVIQSDDDPYGTIAQVDAIAAGSGGPVERLVLSDCGHAPHRDQAERTLAAIVEFVGAHR
jgi:pimeloyl-ACP methyl ester carboxylesterase